MATDTFYKSPTGTLVNTNYADPTLTGGTTYDISGAPTIPTSITSSNLTPSTPVSIPQPSIPSAANAITSGSEPLSQSAQLKIQEQNKLNEQQQKADQEMAKLEADKNAILGVTQSKATQLNDPKLQALSETARKASDSLLVDQRTQQNEVRAVSEGRTGAENAAQVNSKINEINRAHAFTQADLQLTYHLANSDLQAAQDTINKTIELQLEPLKIEYDFRSKIYDSLKGDLTKSEDRLFQLQNQDIQNEQQTIKDKGQAMQSIVSEALKNGVQIPQSLSSAMLKAKDANEIYNLVSQSGLSLQNPLDVKIKEAQLAQAQAQLNALNSQTQARIAETRATQPVNTPLQLSQAQSGITNIDNLLKNKTGLETSVGTSGLTRSSGFWGTLGKIVTGLVLGGGTGAAVGSVVPVVGTAIGGITGAVVGVGGAIGKQTYSQLSGQQQDFISGVEQLRSGLTLETLISAKQKGATFGALSDAEGRLLAASASKIGTWAQKDKDGNITGYNVNEDVFRGELNKINNFAKLDYVLKGGLPTDVGAVTMQNGDIAVQNPDGTYTKIN